MATQTPEYTLEQLSPIRRLMTKSGVSLAAVVRAASGIVKPIAQRVMDRKTTLPTAIRPTEAELIALTRLEVALDTAEWPTTRRLLTVEEKRDLLVLLDTVKTIKKLTERAEVSLKAAFFNHLDIQAEAAEDIIDDTTEITRDGWYALPGRVEHPDVDVVASREVRTGATSLSDESLQDLEADGLIDHDTYLSWTRAVRVPDELTILGAIARNPWHSLLIAQATTRAASSPALIKRDAK